MSGRPPTSRPSAGGDERRPVDLTPQAATQRPSPLTVDLDAIAADIEWPRRPSATLGSARTLYLQPPEGTPLRVGRPGRVEPLDRARLLSILRFDITLVAEECGPHET